MEFLEKISDNEEVVSISNIAVSHLFTADDFKIEAYDDKSKEYYNAYSLWYNRNQDRIKGKNGIYSIIIAFTDKNCHYRNRRMIILKNNIPVFFSSLYQRELRYIPELDIILYEDRESETCVIDIYKGIMYYYDCEEIL